MVKKYLVVHNDQSSIVHYDGPFQPGDVALCGSDLMGDSSKSHGGWAAALISNRKVNCVACNRIIEHVNKIKKQTKAS